MGRQPLFKSGAPIDEKRISHIERILSRLIRRSKKTAEAMLTPYPISNCITGEDVHGTVLKYMFSAKGTIGKGLIRFDKKLKSGVIVTVTLENDLGGQAKTFIANRNQILIEPNLEVYSGDRLTVIVEPSDSSEGKLNEVWIAFLWAPHVGEATVKSFLIDKLDEIELTGDEDA